MSVKACQFRYVTLDMQSSLPLFHVVVALVVIIDYKIRCIPSKGPVICDDIAEAIDYLYKHLPARMTLTDKCKRYALMASYLKPKTRLSRMLVSRALNLPDDQVNKFYQRFAARNRLGGHFSFAAIRTAL